MYAGPFFGGWFGPYFGETDTFDGEIGQMAATIQIHPGTTKGSEKYYVGNDMVLEVLGLKDDISDDPITDAVIRVTLYNRDGSTVSGQSWPATMTHVDDGDYRLQLEYDLSVTVNTHVTARVVATSGSGSLHGRWDVPIWVALRDQ